MTAQGHQPDLYISKVVPGKQKTRRLDPVLQWGGSSRAESFHDLELRHGRKKAQQREDDKANSCGIASYDIVSYDITSYAFEVQSHRPSSSRSILRVIQLLALLLYMLDEVCTASHVQVSHGIYIHTNKTSTMSELDIRYRASEGVPKRV